MGHLRDIMQKLAAAQGPAPVARPPDFLPAGGGIAAYRDQLQRCTTAMILYEWTWLHQQLEDLHLCISHPAMAKALGGEQHGRQLIRQGEACLEALVQECSQRNLKPERQAHSVVTGEHAWQVSNAAIRQQWGFDGEPHQPGELG
jgi:hypothetical protein